MENQNETTKYILYTRKSTESEDRQVASLDDQNRELVALEKRDGLRVVERFGGKTGGESHSAYKRGRPIFGHVMEQIEAGRANGLLVWHANRLARNALDGGWIITLLDEGKLVEVRTPFRTYRNTPDDKHSLHQEFGNAKRSSDDNSVAVTRGLRSKVAKGWFPSQVPLGYLNSKDKGKGNNDIIKDPERFEIVEMMWRLMLRGNHNPTAILKTANEQWGLRTRATKRCPPRPLSRSQIYRLFTNPFYCGQFEYGKPILNEDGKLVKPLYRGNHPPMITEKEFDQVQRLLGREGRPRPKRHRFAYAGLLRCGSCGAMVTAEAKVKRQKNGNVHHYTYYHCTKRKNPACTERSVEVHELEAQIDALLSQLTISEALRNWAINYLDKDEETTSDESVLASQQRALASVARRLTNLKAKFLSDENANGELFGDQEFAELKSELLREQATLQATLKTDNETAHDVEELSKRTFDFACYARLWFNQGDPDTKQAILASLGSNLSLTMQKLALRLRGVFRLLSERLQEAERIFQNVRTDEKRLAGSPFVLSTDDCLILRRLTDDVRTCLEDSDDDYSDLPILSATAVKLQPEHLEWLQEKSNRLDCPVRRRRADFINRRLRSS